MRLAVVTSTGQFGGAEATDIHVLAELVRRGIDVRAAMPAPGPLGRAWGAVGVDCSVVASPAALDSLSRRYARSRDVPGPAVASATARYEARLMAWLRAVRPHAVLATGFRAQLAVAPVAALLRLAVGWVASDFVPTGPPACRLWSALARRQPRVILTYSRAAAAQPALAGARSVVPVLSGIDLARFPPGPPERAPRLLLVGHLTPLKNHLGFVRLAERVREQVADVQATIAGSAIYRTTDHDAYAEQVRAACAAANVDLLAPDADGVGALMREASILLHVSTVPETFGRVCAEAMASGAVVVGFDQGATSEVVGDTGVLVAPGDLDAATQVCVELLGRGARRAALAAAARERVESQFRVERAAREGADALAAGLGFA